MQAQHHHTGEKAATPPDRHLQTKERGQKAVRGSRDRIGVKEVLPDYGKGPLRHDVGENKNGADITLTGQVGPRNQESHDSAKEQSHHAGSHRQQKGVGQRYPEVGFGQAAGEEIHVVHQRVSRRFLGKELVDGPLMNLEGVLDNGHNRQYRGDGQNHGHQDQDDVMGKRKKCFELIQPDPENRSLGRIFLIHRWPLLLPSHKKSSERPPVNGRLRDSGDPGLLQTGMIAAEGLKFR